MWTSEHPVLQTWSGVITCGCTACSSSLDYMAGPFHTFRLEPHTSVRRTKSFKPTCAGCWSAMNFSCRRESHSSPFKHSNLYYTRETKERKKINYWGCQTTVRFNFYFPKFSSRLPPCDITLPVHVIWLHIGQAISDPGFCSYLGYINASRSYSLSLWGCWLGLSLSPSISLLLLALSFSAVSPTFPPSPSLFGLPVFTVVVVIRHPRTPGSITGVRGEEN